MDLLDLLYKIFSPQSISGNIFPHTFLFLICNIQRWRWKISKTSLKWGLSSRSVDFFVVRLLYIYHIFIQVFRCFYLYSLRCCTKVLLTTSVCPSVCGWNVVDLFKFVSIFSYNVVQNALRNLVSLSEMMFLGIQKCTQTYPKNKFVASCPLIVFLQGIRTHILLNLWTTMNM